MRITFAPPASPARPVPHHALAAAGNVATADAAIETLFNARSAKVDVERTLLRAGKSFVLKRTVEEALTHPRCRRIAITAFANKQVFPLAEALGKQLGRERVCLYTPKDWAGDASDALREATIMESDYTMIPRHVAVVLGTSHMLGYTSRILEKHLGLATDGEHLLDLLFVDEAWQLPLHRYREVERLAPIAIGVGDGGQLPPIDPGQNPWRGDRGYNPYHAWPIAYERDRKTWVRELADGVLVASTIDSWQGQTNAITVAIHSLSGACALDEFNSAFGRPAVTCTRATHGLLLVGPNPVQLR